MSSAASLCGTGIPCRDQVLRWHLKSMTEDRVLVVFILSCHLRPPLLPYLCSKQNLGGKVQPPDFINQKLSHGVSEEPGLVSHLCSVKMV